MNRRKFISVGCSSAIAALAGCTSGDDDGQRQEADTDPTDTPTATSAETATKTTEQQAKVELLEHEFYQEEYSSGVKGILENKTDTELGYVAVNVYFLDADGVQIGEGLDNTSDLAAGRKWKFDAMQLDGEPADVDKYEIEAEVTDF